MRIYIMIEGVFVAIDMLDILLLVDRWKSASSEQTSYSRYPVDNEGTLKTKQEKYCNLLHIIDAKWQCLVSRQTSLGTEAY